MLPIQINKPIKVHKTLLGGKDDCVLAYRESSTYRQVKEVSDTHLTEYL